MANYQLKKSIGTVEIIPIVTARFCYGQYNHSPFKAKGIEFDISSEYEVILPNRKKMFATLDTYKKLLIFKYKEEIEIVLDGKKVKIGGFKVSDEDIKGIKAARKATEQEKNETIEKEKNEYLSGIKMLDKQEKVIVTNWEWNEKVTKIVVDTNDALTNNALKDLMREYKEIEPAFEIVDNFYVCLKENFVDCSSIPQIIEKIEKLGIKKQSEKEIEFEEHKVTEKTEYDEGGEYKEYVHTFTVKGKTYIVTEWNMFDCGYSIECNITDDIAEQLKKYVKRNTCLEIRM